MSRRRATPAVVATVVVAAALLAAAGRGAATTGAPQAPPPPPPPSQPTPVPGGELDGSGDVDRQLLRFEELRSPQTPAAPVDEHAFALPPGAAMPRHSFEGTLTLRGTGSAGGFRAVRGCPPGLCGEHLPPFEVDLVQHGSHLVPAEQGLVITGDPQPGYLTYNLLVGPGRAWSERSDAGRRRALSRASLPFALVQRNQNCTHYGVLTFLYGARRVSQVRYQVTAETCQPAQFDMWGQVPATYERHEVEGADALREAHAAEVAGRLPTRPLSALATDHPEADIDLSVIGGGITPEAMTAYGVVYRGVNYVADATSPNPACRTRSGVQAYCRELRLPSYSVAKTVFAGLSLAALAGELGPGVLDERIADLVPEASASPGWRDAPATLDDAADMATGNYLDPGFEADEADANTFAFLESEPYATKLAAALAYPRHPGEEGTTWTYHTVDTFLLVQAATELLRGRRGPDADLFDHVVERVYDRIGLSSGARRTLRTDNLPAARRDPTGGRPLGGLGLFLTVDDVAKLASLYQRNGAHRGEQLLDRREVLAGMQRSAADTGVAAVSADGEGAGDGTVAAGGSRYSNGLWAFPTTGQVPGCALRVPYMSGYGGITVAMLPNGATYYYVSDGGEFAWADVVGELDGLSPLCAPTTTTVTADRARTGLGGAVTFTARVRAASRSWTPTGTVQFRDGGERIGRPRPLDGSGRARLTTDRLPRGRRTITAEYHPDLTRATGIAPSPARTELVEPCPLGATTCAVASTRGIRVGDTVVMGTRRGTNDSHVVTRLTRTTISWAGAHQRVDHGPGERVWVQNTAGGGFSGSTSAPLGHRVGGRPVDGAG